MTGFQTWQIMTGLWSVTLFGKHIGNLSHEKPGFSARKLTGQAMGGFKTQREALQWLAT